MDIHRQILAFIDDGISFVLATVLNAQGSTPGKPGTKALIDHEGKIYGTLGGGAVEALTQTTGQQACKSQQSTIFEFQFDGTHAADNVPICGGSMQILIDTNPAKNRHAYSLAAEAIKNRTAGVLITTIDTTNLVPETDVRFFSGDELAGNPDISSLDEIRKSLAKEKFAILELEKSSHRIIIEPIIPKPMLLIVGGGHIGQSLAFLAGHVGFDITVTDDRNEFIDPSLFPEETTCLCGSISKVLEEFDITSDTYIVIVTRGHNHDAEALHSCIHSPAAYIGMIGSKRKVAMMRAHFIESGIANQDQFDRVYAPIGLDIAAVTVPEIAASITSQLIAVRRGLPESRIPNPMVQK